jgi:hypothetical protein
MWVFTREGFFSVVHDIYCEPDEVMVLARKMEDIESLAGKLEGGTGLVLEFAHADYRYRMAVKKIAWAEYLRRCAMDIDYDNYKNLIDPEDLGRLETYSSCWKALKKWQDTV